MFRDGGQVGRGQQMGLRGGPREESKTRWRRHPGSQGEGPSCRRLTSCVLRSLVRTRLTAGLSNTEVTGDLDKSCFDVVEVVVGKPAWGLRENCLLWICFHTGSLINWVGMESAFTLLRGLRLVLRKPKLKGPG